MLASHDRLMSVTAETSQDPIGASPLEQSVESFRHATILAWSSVFDFAAHVFAVVAGNRGRGRVRIVAFGVLGLGAVVDISHKYLHTWSCPR